MKDFLEIDFRVKPPEARDILLALLDNLGYDSFQETETGLKAYVLESDFDEEELKKLSLFSDSSYDISYEIDRLENKNWNEEWETNYEPINVDDKLYIRAPFHPQSGQYTLELVIIPKMSFGTGHHQTTRLMSRLLLANDLRGKRVLDMGTGTGILAILCEKLGASSVDALDNFDWAVENTEENCLLNNCRHIKAEHGDADAIKGREYDMVVANINRNVLLEDIKYYCQTLQSGGQLLLSGFFADDFALINQEVQRHRGKLVAQEEENRWLACQFVLN